MTHVVKLEPAAQALEAVAAVEDGFGPDGVIEIPANSLAEATLEAFLWDPGELSVGTPSIDSVAEIVAGTVGDEDNRSAVRLAVGSRTEFVEQTAEFADEVDIPAFVVAADAIGAAWDSSFRRGE
jgi:hypothetical protein